MRTLRGGNAVAVIATLNPVIRGWAAYYRTVVSQRCSSSLDHYLWKLTYKWARWRHPNKPKHWVVGRYFGTFNKFRNDRWVFGDRDSGAYLVKFAWTTSSGTRWSRARRPPMTPPWPVLGRPAAQKANLRWTATPSACSPGRTGTVRSAGTTCSPPISPPPSPQQWERWWLQVTRKAIAASYLIHHGGPAPPAMTRPAWCTHPASAGSGPTARETGTASARNALAACLSRVRGLTRTHGS